MLVAIRVDRNRYISSALKIFNRVVIGIALMNMCFFNRIVVSMRVSMSVCHDGATESMMMDRKAKIGKAGRRDTVNARYILHFQVYQIIYYTRLFRF